MPRQQINFNREDVIWAAGLYEGEGCLSIHPRTNDPSKWVFAIMFRMVDEDVVRKFASIFPFGNVTGPYQIKKWKPIWQYQVSIGEDVYALCMMLYPFLGLRRQAKIEEFVELFKNQHRVYKRAVCRVNKS